MKTNKRIFAWIVAMCITTSLAGCTQPNTTPTDPLPATLGKDLVVLYTNDVHCAVNEGMGYAGLAALQKQYEAEGNHVLLVDAGDAVQGAPMGTISSGTHLVDIMNKVGYDVAIPGNHEFDYGMAQFKALVERAEYPYISSNMMDMVAGTPVLPPYQLFNLDGVIVAFVGVTTPATITSSTPAYFQNEAGKFIYEFSQDTTGEELYSVVQDAVDGAHAAGAQYVFLLAHLGIEAGTSPWMSTEVIANTTGIDAVIDGHSHSNEACIRMKNKNNEWVLLTQTGSKLSNVGMLLLTRDGNLTTGFVSGGGKDAEVDAMIKDIEKQYEAELAQVVGKSETVLTSSDPATGVRLIRNAETNLGDFCADAYRIVSGADIAIVNGGGIRADIPQGDITYGDVLGVHPYGNQLCVVEATGQEILDALEHGARAAPEESGGFLQVSGLAYTIDTAMPTSVVLDKNGMFVEVTGKRRVSDVTVGGKPIDPAATYTVASHDYLLKNSGDGFTIFVDNKYIIEDFMLDNQVLMTYVEKTLGGIVPTSYADAHGEGRITLN